MRASRHADFFPNLARTEITIQTYKRGPRYALDRPAKLGRTQIPQLNDIHTHSSLPNLTIMSPKIVFRDIIQRQESRQNLTTIGVDATCV
jgi:hypothetical protein